MQSRVPPRIRFIIIIFILQKKIFQKVSNVKLDSKNKNGGWSLKFQKHTVDIKYTIT